jgi:uncharacterized protein (TIGR02996 family)
MDAEERALLAAIIANPEEDTPRLVYADWLQEHGREERAELIRAQIGLARTKGVEGFDRERHQWSERVRALLHAHSLQWRRELPKLPRVSWGPFERGMVESVTVTVRRVRKWDAVFSAGLTSMFGHAPLRILRVNFASWGGHGPEECDEMLRWEGLSRFEELHITGFFNYYGGDNPQPPFFARLWAHRWGERPRALDTREFDLQEESVVPLLATPADWPLPTLTFANTKLSESTRSALTTRFGDRVQFV